MPLASDVYQLTVLLAYHLLDSFDEMQVIIRKLACKQHFAWTMEIWSDNLVLRFERIYVPCSYHLWMTAGALRGPIFVN